MKAEAELKKMAYVISPMKETVVELKSNKKLKGKKMSKHKKVNMVTHSKIHAFAY